MILTIGKHKVTNASVDDPIVEQMLAGETANVLYSDPPWGDGNAKYWATIARRMTGKEVRQISSGAILSAIFRIILRHVRGHVFIEYGCKWEADVMSLFHKHLHNVKVFYRQYESGSRLLPCITVYGGTSKQFSFDGKFNDDDSGAEEVRNVIAQVAVPGGIVIDPCCGMGYTARAAVANGMIFRGNELNSARLAKTIAFLKSTKT